MESQLVTLNEKPAETQGNGVVQVVLPALFRLALLVGPLTASVLMLGKSPVLCVLVSVALLALWLSVDIGPFRATKAEPSEKRQAPLPSVRNLTKAQWWNGLFCRLLILGAIYYSKLSI